MAFRVEERNLCVGFTATVVYWEWSPGVVETESVYVMQRPAGKFNRQRRKCVLPAKRRFVPAWFIIHFRRSAACRFARCQPFSRDLSSHEFDTGYWRVGRGVIGAVTGLGWFDDVHRDLRSM